MSKFELAKEEKRQELEFQELQVKMNEMIAMQQSKLNKSFRDLRGEQEQLKEKLSLVEEDNQKAKREYEKAQELEFKRHRVAEHRFGYVGLSDLGQSYEVSIGAKTMGKLLRLAGLAKKKQSRTEPMRSATLNDYAKSMMYGAHPTYQWNPEKCIEKIDRWLEQIGVIDEFYSIDNEKELMEYINELYELYGN